MKASSIAIAGFAIAAVAVCPPVRSADKSGSPIEVAPVVFEAPVIENVGTTVRATGGVSMFSASRRMRASVVEYDLANETGTMKDVSFTTCDKPVPDYHFEAREVSLHPGNRLTARRISVFLGKVRVFALPGMKLRLGGGPVSTDVFPRPSFDKDGGFTLAQKLQLADSDSLRASADLQVSTGKGVQGEFWNIWGFAGNLGAFPGKFLTYESLRKGALTMPRSAAEMAGIADYKQPTGVARLRQFSRISINQRTYDINNTALVVYRQPEVGLEYVAPALSFTRTRIDPRLEIYPVITTMWGRYREFPSAIGFANRSSFSVLGAVNVLPLGKNTAVQPLVTYSVSAYSTPSDYRTWGGGIDASHLFNNGSSISLRYIRRHESGATPFQFDNVDILHEFQGAFQARIHGHTIGFASGVDLDDGTVYDWSVLYGYHTDCLAASVSWSELQRRFAIDIRLIAK